MGATLANFKSNERLDLDDLVFAVQSSLDEAQRAYSKTISTPSQAPAIISGFDMSGSGGATLTVTGGSAMLSSRDQNGVNTSLPLTVSNSKAISVASLSNATYGIFIRAEYVDATTQNRVFWNSTSSIEFGTAIPTRKGLDWSVRLAVSSPGQEYLQIGSVVVASALISSITKQRNFYFEGPENNTYTPVWGTGINDRNVDRATYGIKDLQTQMDAIRSQFASIFSGKWYGTTVDVTATATAGLAGLSGRAAGATTIGVFAGTSGLSGVEATYRANYENTGLLALSAGGAQAAVILADTGSYGLIVKGQGATLADITAGKGATGATPAIMAFGGSSGPSFYTFNNSATWSTLIANNNGGTAATFNGTSSVAGVAITNGGAGVGLSIGSTTGAGLTVSSTGGQAATFAGVSASAGVTIANTGSGVGLNVQAAGNAIEGVSSAGYGGKFTGNASRAPVQLVDLATLPGTTIAGDLVSLNGRFLNYNGAYWQAPSYYKRSGGAGGTATNMTGSAVLLAGQSNTASWSSTDFGTGSVYEAFFDITGTNGASSGTVTINGKFDTAATGNTGQALINNFTVAASGLYVISLRVVYYAFNSSTAYIYITGSVANGGTITPIQRQFTSITRTSGFFFALYGIAPSGTMTLGPYMTEIR